MKIREGKRTSPLLSPATYLKTAPRGGTCPSSLGTRTWARGAALRGQEHTVPRGRRRSEPHPSAPTCPALTGPVQTLTPAPLPDREDRVGRPRGPSAAAAARALLRAGPPSAAPPRAAWPARAGGGPGAGGHELPCGRREGKKCVGTRGQRAGLGAQGLRVPLPVTPRGAGTQPLPAALLRPPRGFPGRPAQSPRPQSRAGRRPLAGRSRGRATVL